MSEQRHADNLSHEINKTIKDLYDAGQITTEIDVIVGLANALLNYICFYSSCVEEVGDKIDGIANAMHEEAHGQFQNVHLSVSDNSTHH
jgi:hypothetical protein